LLRRLSVLYAERSRALTESLNTWLPDFQQVPISGGSSSWVKAPPGVDTDLLAKAALQEGIVIEPGHVFYHRPGPDKNNYIRMGFSSIDKEKIPAGVEGLARVYRRLYPDQAH